MREPITIGLDDSPIVIQVKGVDWSFNPDPQPDFLIKMMDVAKSLQGGDLTEYTSMSELLADQLTEPAQRKQWDKAKHGLSTTNAILTAYLGEVHNLPTEPS